MIANPQDIANPFTWYLETVDINWAGEDTSLAIGGSGEGHISYHDETNGSLKHAFTTESLPEFSNWIVPVITIVPFIAVIVINHRKRGC